MSVDIVKLEEVLDRQHEQVPFSGVIEIREQGKVVFDKAYGQANKAEGIPNLINTRFGIASGAKTFTAVAICQLVEKGLLSFDTLLKDCLPIDFPHFNPAVTVHHLLTHSSGIPDYFDETIMDDYEALWKDRPMYNIRGPRDFLPMFQDEPMKFTPGQGWAYNNAGYIVLGLIVEQVSGQNFPQYVEENIFAACDMADSGYFAMDALPARTAYGYIAQGEDGWKTNIYSVGIIGGPDGGSFSTAPDLAKFWDALLGYRLLNEDTIRLMLTPHAVAVGEDEGTYYGYGIWMVKKGETIASYYMIGEDPGVAFFSGFYPQKQTQYSVLGNVIKGTWPTSLLVADAIKEA